MQGRGNQSVRFRTIAERAFDTVLLTEQMKTKAKPNPNRPRAAAKRAPITSVAKLDGSPVVRRPVIPLKERRLVFGNKWDYAPAPETFDYIKIPPRHDLFVDGKFVEPHSCQYFDSLNPATEEKLSEIAAADEVDVDAAVKAARRAYQEVWSKMPGRERGKYIYRIARIIQEKARELAGVGTKEGRKPDQESRGGGL